MTEEILSGSCSNIADPEWEPSPELQAINAWGEETARTLIRLDKNTEDRFKAVHARISLIFVNTHRIMTQLESMTVSEKKSDHISWIVAIQVLQMLVIIALVVQAVGGH